MNVEKVGQIFPIILLWNDQASQTVCFLQKEKEDLIQPDQKQG